MTRPEDVARGIRHQHLLNVSLATAGGNPGDLKLATDLAEQAITTALREAEAAGRQEVATLLADDSYLRPLADYFTRGHLSYCGQLRDRDGGLVDEIAEIRSRQSPEGRLANQRAG